MMIASSDVEAGWHIGGTSEVKLNRCDVAYQGNENKFIRLKTKQSTLRTTEESTLSLSEKQIAYHAAHVQLATQRLTILPIMLPRKTTQISNNLFKKQG